MSSGELQVEIDKLEIAPTLPLIKFVDNQIPISLNPFYNNDLDGLDNMESQPNAKQKTLFRRRCRHRSESYIDEFKKSDNNSNSDHLDASCAGRNIPKVQKHPLKKTAASSGPKKILREPILRTLQLKGGNKNSRKSIQSLSEDESINCTTNKKTANKDREFSNFRDYIRNNVNFEESNFEISSRFHQVRTQPSIQNQSKSFTTLQQPKVQNHDYISDGPQCSNTRRPTSSDTSSIKTPQEHKPAATTAKMGTSITCSQQAGNSSSVNSSCDDVTINELASYFDTMVHIPKKMSTMAEMMYI